MSTHPSPPAFASRLKTLREERGLTQAQLAEKAGLHLGAVFKLEQGRRSPTWDTVQALAAALGVDCTAFQGTSSAPEDEPVSPATQGRKDVEASAEEPPRRAGKAADQEQGKGNRPASKGRGKKGKGE